jgi:hypothetical protein
MSREEYATALALASSQIVAAVHRGDDAGPFIKAALSLTPPSDTDPYRALVTVLSAQIDPDTCLTERLDWVRSCAPEVVSACGVSA